MHEKLMAGLYASIVLENVEIYKELFNDEGGDENNIIEYWKNALVLYRALDDSQKEIFFSIIKTVITDTVSNVLGVLDGTTPIDEKDWDFQFTANGVDVGGEMQDAFLAYVEESESYV